MKKIYNWVKTTINKKIKTITFTEEYNYENCTICLEDFELNSKVTILPCKHIYHKTCIYEWIHSKNDNTNVKCPNCNKLIYTNHDELIEHLI